MLTTKNNADSGASVMHWNGDRDTEGSTALDGESESEFAFHDQIEVSKRSARSLEITILLGLRIQRIR